MTSIYYSMDGVDTMYDYAIYVMHVNEFSSNSIWYYGLQRNREVSVNVHIMYIHALTQAYNDKQGQCQVRLIANNPLRTRYIIIYWSMRKRMPLTPKWHKPTA